MPTVGIGVRELRVQVGQPYRVLYVTRFREATYVLHAFEKSSQKTNLADLRIARQRFDDSETLNR